MHMWGERNTAVTTYFGEIVFCFFLQKWKPFSIIQIVTNFYNSSLNGFKDIWHRKYVVSQGPIFFNAILLYLDLQQCCIEHFSNPRKYLNAVLLYLDLTFFWNQKNTWMQYCCIKIYHSIALNFFSISKELFNAKLLSLHWISSLAIVLH